MVSTGCHLHRGGAEGYLNCFDSACAVWPSQVEAKGLCMMMRAVRAAGLDL